jgi:hypothetical protein
MGYGGNEDDFYILKKEHGDRLSKNCWYIFLRGDRLKKWKNNQLEINWVGSAEEQPTRHDR